MTTANSNDKNKFQPVITPRLRIQAWPGLSDNQFTTLAPIDPVSAVLDYPQTTDSPPKRYIRRRWVETNYHRGQRVVSEFVEETPIPGGARGLSPDDLKKLFSKAPREYGPWYSLVVLVQYPSYGIREITLPTIIGPVNLESFVTRYANAFLHGTPSYVLVNEYRRKLEAGKKGLALLDKSGEAQPRDYGLTQSGVVLKNTPPASPDKKPATPVKDAGSLAASDASKVPPGESPKVKAAQEKYKNFHKNRP